MAAQDRGFKLGNDFGVRLSRLRLEKGYTRQELADRAQLSERTVRDIEQGKRKNPSDKTVLLLADAIGVQIAELVAYEDSPSAQQQPPGSRRVSLPLVLILAAIATVGGFGYFVSTSGASFEIVDGNLVCRDGLLGKTRWTRDWQADATILKDESWRDGAIVVGLGCRAADGGRVLMINRRDGSTLAEMAPEAGYIMKVFGDPTLAYGPGYGVSDMRFIDLDGDGTKELLVKFMHGQFYPCYLAVYDQDGQKIASYLNRGHISDIHVVDLDDDGCDEVIASGTDNCSHYGGGTLIRLEQGFFKGASFDSICGGDPDVPDSAAVRLELPSFGNPYMGLLGHPRLTASGIGTFRGPEGRTLISASINAGDIGVILTCDADLHPLRVVASDAFLARVSTLPDSVRQKEGFPSQPWLDNWLAGFCRYEAGQGPMRWEARCPAGNGAEPEQSIRSQK